MSNFKLNRRKFISSTGVVLGLPFLESIMPFHQALAATAPGRAVWLYMPNGTYNKDADSPWNATNGLLTNNLPDVLSPFAANKGDITILNKMKSSVRSTTNSNYYKFNNNGGGHVSASSSFLSQQIIDNPESKSCDIKNPSIDQVIAINSGKDALTMHPGGGNGNGDSSPFNYSHSISFKNGNPVQPMKNPIDVYNKLFAMVATTIPGTPAGTIPKAAQGSILDSAVRDLADLKSKLGKLDKTKLDQYLTSVEEIEKTIAKETTPPENGNSCEAPGQPSGGLNNFGGENVKDYLPRVKAYLDMIAFAFKCDLSRSASFMFDSEVGNRILGSQVPSDLVFNGGNLDKGMHIGIAHDGGRTKNITKDRLYMSLMLYLVDKLKSITDVDGSTVLDNTIIHMGYGVGSGDHRGGGVPNVLAGGKNLRSKVGYAIDASSIDQKDLLYTIGSKMGLDINSFEGSSKSVTI